MKLTHNDIRGLIASGAKWLAAIYVFRLTTLILYSMLMTVEMKIIVDDNKDLALARTIIIAVSFVSQVIFAVAYLILYLRNNGAERRRVIAACADSEFSPVRFCLNYWPVIAVQAGLTVFTQLLFCGFYAAFGFKYTAETGATIIEKLHIADAGWYLLTGMPILGLLLSAVTAVVMLYLVHLAAVAIWRRDARL